MSEKNHRRRHVRVQDWDKRELSSRREKKETQDTRSKKTFHAMEYRSSRCRKKLEQQRVRKKNIRRKASPRRKEGEETSAGKSGMVGRGGGEGNRCECGCAWWGGRATNR